MLREKSKIKGPKDADRCKRNAPSRLSPRFDRSVTHARRLQETFPPNGPLRAVLPLNPGRATLTAVSTFDFPSDNSANKEKGKMMRHLCEIGDFVRRLGVQARFGDLSRAPLRLLRFQVSGNTAECDLMARPADAWDADLRPRASEINVSMQALKDAIEVRNLLFRVLPDIYSAAVRVYRKSTNGSAELIITGTVSREERSPSSVRSLAMRAKLFGLRFWLDDGTLENLQPEEYAVNS